MNQERLQRIIEDMRECKTDIEECVFILQNNQDNPLMIKLAKSSLRQLFVSFHTILEDFCSIILKELKKFKVGITLNESFKVLKSNNVIDNELYAFLEKSILIRNRISHRYKEPTHQELFNHIAKYQHNFDSIIEIAQKYLIS